VVDRLKLKGGTILRAAVATYQKTRVKLLSAVDRAGRSLPLANTQAAAVPVAASTTHQPIEPLDSDIPMTTETPTVAAMPTDLTEKLLTAIEAIGTRLSAIEEKQQAAEQAEADRLAAEQAAAAEAAAVEAMAQKVAAAIAPSIDERIAAVMGTRPVAQAQRRSVATPVVPGAAATPVAAGAASPEVSALLTQLDRTPAHNIAGRIALKQRIADLERNAALSR